MLRLWTLNLCVATFVLTILGTFLTRSGILSSVHAFTTGAIGYYFLAFIAIVLGATLVLVAGHSDRISTKGKLGGAASRETVFLLNNLFLTAVMLTVLVGTLYPLVAEAIRGVTVSVGEPFFNRMIISVGEVPEAWLRPEVFLQAEDVLVRQHPPDFRIGVEQVSEYASTSGTCFSAGRQSAFACAVNAERALLDDSLLARTISEVVLSSIQLCDGDFRRAPVEAACPVRAG